MFCWSWKTLCLLWSLSLTTLLLPSWFNSCLAVVVLRSTCLRSPVCPMASFIFLSQGQGQILSFLLTCCCVVSDCPQIAGAGVLTVYPNPSLLRGNNNSHSASFLAFIVTSEDKCKLISRIVILFEEQRIVRGDIFFVRIHLEVQSPSVVLQLPLSYSPLLFIQLLIIFFSC